jgi:hypothetical protein
MQLINNSILSTYYSKYINLKNIKTNNNKYLTSTNLTDLAVSNLYDKKYELNEFDIYLYIYAYDFIRDSLNFYNINLSEGINSSKYIYKNILIDLFYNNIPGQVINKYPLSIVFGLKRSNKEREIINLTRTDINNYINT